MIAYLRRWRPFVGTSMVELEQQQLVQQRRLVVEPHGQAPASAVVPVGHKSYQIRMQINNDEPTIAFLRINLENSKPKVQFRFIQQICENVRKKKIITSDQLLSRLHHMLLYFRHGTA